MGSTIWVGGYVIRSHSRLYSRNNDNSMIFDDMKVWASISPFEWSKTSPELLFGEKLWAIS
jgi:hypothetical protein